MNWESLIDDPALISALRSNHMPSPTEIQTKSLPHSLNYHQDLIISSKTGSGKTLCFGIPILKFCQNSSTLQSLIISPTRELCMQIEAHIKAINHKNLGILTLIGGISHEKQERLLKRKPEILIATPGRLWEFIKDRQNDYVRTVSEIKILVIDEADRMIQMGHFKELRLIVKYLEDPSIVAKEEAVMEENDGVIDLNFFVDKNLGKEKEKRKIKRQTFVVSATMNIEKNARKAFGGKLGRFKDDGEDIMEKLNTIVQFRGKPKVIDLTTETRLPDGLKEYIILCTENQKHGLLHYVLKEYTSTKSIIFTNTISQARKLIQFLRFLEFKVSKLDGKMQQRDRLKKLEKFLSSNDILIATDVAARGLDLPEVGLIIHYNLPQNLENYIHRSGRTARIYNKGTSIAFIGPGDTRNLLEIEKTLNKKIEKLHIDVQKLQKSEESVEIAKELAETESLNCSNQKNQSWNLKNSEAVGLESEEQYAKTGRKKIKIMKSRLKQIKTQTDLPQKRASVITPELFELAKKQKII